MGSFPSLKDYENLHLLYMRWANYFQEPLPRSKSLPQWHLQPDGYPYQRLLPPPLSCR